MLSYSENSRKQEIIHQCFHLPQPPKRDSCDSCDSFSAYPHLPLFRGNLLYIYNYIYNKLNIIITI